MMLSMLSSSRIVNNFYGITFLNKNYLVFVDLSLVGNWDANLQRMSTTKIVMV